MPLYLLSFIYRRGRCLTCRPQTVPWRQQRGGGLQSRRQAAADSRRKESTDPLVTTRLAGRAASPPSRCPNILFVPLHCCPMSGCPSAPLSGCPSVRLSGCPAASLLRRSAVRSLPSLPMTMSPQCGRPGSVSLCCCIIRRASSFRGWPPLRG